MAGRGVAELDRADRPRAERLDDGDSGTNRVSYQTSTAPVCTLTCTWTSCQLPSYTAIWLTVELSVGPLYIPSMP